MATIFHDNYPSAFPQPRRTCNLTRHDNLLTTNHQSIKLPSDISECPHCDTNWTYLLKPPQLSQPSETENTTPTLTSVISNIVTIQLQNPDFLAAISHFCDCELKLNEDLKPRKMHRFERLRLRLRLIGRGKKREMRVKQQRIISLLHEFYRELYFEGYTTLRHLTKSASTPSSTIKTAPKTTPKPKPSPLSKQPESSCVKWNNVTPEEYLTTISMAAWYSHFKKEASWEGNYKMFPQRKGRRERMFRTEFIEGSRAVGNLREGLRGCRRKVLILGVEALEVV